MPFRSKAQERYLYAKHPEIAKRWQAEYGQPSRLPEHAKEKPMGRLYKSKPKPKKVKRITEDDPRFNPSTMGNRRGSKNTKTTPGPNGQYRPT